MASDMGLKNIHKNKKLNNVELLVDRGHPGPFILITILTNKC